jgi:hypothetical protein
MKEIVVQKIVVPDTGRSQIMPPVTVSIPMPQGAAIPAQAAPQQDGSEAIPEAAPAKSK